MNETVLVVEDDPETQVIIKSCLVQGGYKVAAISSGQEAVEAVFQHRPSLILLDVLLPQLDGWEVCRRVREACDIPIIMMSCLSSKADVAKGLDLGADDYICKPVRDRELLARVRAVLRRAAVTRSSGLNSFKWQNLEVNLKAHSIYVSGRRIPLSPTEFRLLSQLIQNLNKVVSHDQLLHRVWGAGYLGDRNSVRTYIHYLRSKLEEDAQNPKHIVTVRGRGYSFAMSGLMENASPSVAAAAYRPGQRFAEASSGA